MERERGSNPRRYFDSMLDFARSGQNAGIRRFVLEGPTNVSAGFHTFVGKFPNQNGMGSQIVIASLMEGNAIEVSSQILQLKVSQSVEDLMIPEDEKVRIFNEALFALGNMPSVVIGIGETETEERAVVLFSVSGIPPNKALLEIQERVKTDMTQFN